MADTTRPTATAAAATPRGIEPSTLLRYLPSGRSLLVGIAIALLALGAYVGARESSIFAVRTLDIRGGDAQTRAQARAALSSELGTSLLEIDRSTIAAKLAGVSSVLRFTYDRDFPNTLRVTVRREHPVLVLRQGNRAYLVAASGRVLKPLPQPRLSRLPRLWVRGSVPVSVGEHLPPTEAASAHALALANGARLPGGVRSIVSSHGAFALELGTGLELRLGQPSDVLLKLAIAKRILAQTGGARGPGYLDVSAPERPVLSVNPLVGG